jgi:hypothetical protein
VTNEENDQAKAEKSMGMALFRWLPAITAIVAAVATVVVAAISWNAARTATDKDYVSLAMSILSNESSSVPSRNWAVDVLSRLSPVDIPPELASGLVTGRSVLPSELDPTATRRDIMACLNPVLASDLAKPVISAPLFPEKATVGDLAVFGVQQTGQLDKANNHIEALVESINICASPKGKQSK